MMRTFLSAHPWDLAFDDFEASLDRLHSEVGLAGLALWAVTPPVATLRAEGSDPRFFSSRGGFAFAADASKYETTRIKPVSCSWTGKRDPISKIGEALEKRKMSLRVLLSATRMGRVAEKHAEARTKNALGDVSREALCPIHPDVRALLGSIVADVSSRRPLDAVVLTDFESAWSEAFDPGVMGLEDADADARELLSTCFCESCLQAANDAGAPALEARRATEVLFGKAMQGGSDEQRAIAGEARSDPMLRKFFQWRDDAMGRVLQSVIEASPVPVIVARQPESQVGFEGTPAWYGEAAGVLNALELDIEPEGLLCPGANANELYVTLDAALMGQDLVSAFDASAKAGFSAAIVEAMGVLPESGYETLRRALRIVRRR